jgi:small subunit ribosomal protein S6
MRPYEIMIILDADLDDDAIRATIDRIVGLIRSQGGNPGHIERWGRRRFAYELRHRWEGYYVVVEANAEPSVMAELNRALFLTDEVIRHKVIRLPDAVTGRKKAAAAATQESRTATVGGLNTNGA